MTTSAKGVSYVVQWESGGANCVDVERCTLMIVVISALTSQGRVVSPTRALNNCLPKVILHTGVYVYARIICIFLAINLFHVTQVVIFIL